MKLDLRDAFWLVITLVLLTLLGLEWRRARTIASEIREMRSTERPLELVNSNLENAAMYVAWRYNVRFELDRQSLKGVGIDHSTRVTRTIQVATGKEVLEQMFGAQVEVIEQIEKSEAQKRPVYLIRAKK